MHDIDRTQIGNNALETYEYTGSGSPGRVFNEQQEYELASELLEVNSEQEFEQFLGDLIYPKPAKLSAGSSIRRPATLWAEC
jgi:hypothetical protein